MTIEEAFTILNLDIKTHTSDLLLQLNYLYADRQIGLGIADLTGVIPDHGKRSRIINEIEAIKEAHKYVFTKLVREVV